MTQLPARWRVHDLLRVTSAAALRFELPAPDWVADALRGAPWVVVRRAAARDGLIAIGVRGASRAQRCAAWLDPRAVQLRRTPAQLRLAAASLPAPRAALPALRTLGGVGRVLRGLPRSSWGPGGSVGFELASGVATVGADSDLDLVVRCALLPPRARAAALWRALQGVSGSRIDVLLETARGAVALADYARDGPCLLRTAEGPRLLGTPKP